MTDITNCANQYDCRSETDKNQVASDLISRILLRIRKTYTAYKQRRIDRDAFKTLLTLDEASLKDIGVSRNDIIYASKLALHENASQELEKIRAQNITTAKWN